MKTRERAEKILARLKRNFGKPHTALSYKKPLDLLMAVILSAQCTDAQVNRVTPGLFKRFRKAEDYANASIQEIESFVRPTGFYRSKAKSLKETGRILTEKFHGKVPRTMDELMELRGVARKTANIVLTEGFGIVEGIAVDTHVKRLSWRLGLSKNRGPVKIEQDLMKLFPRAEWEDVSMLLILHGRQTCFARKPKCRECGLQKLCPSAFKA
ncbi:MAG: endonuclease III [Candidatus Diapherotrites archaeon]|nr:endonuclease III [Candidatus Diapherotrites archaeon]